MRDELSIDEIVANAPAIVAYAVRQGWCSRPGAMRPTTAAEFRAARWAAGIDDEDPEDEAPAERTEPLGEYLTAFRAIEPGEFTSQDCFRFCVDVGWRAPERGQEMVAETLRRMYFRDEVEEVRRDGACYVWRFAGQEGGAR